MKLLESSKGRSEVGKVVVTRGTPKKLLRSQIQKSSDWMRDGCFRCNEIAEVECRG